MHNADYPLFVPTLDARGGGFRGSRAPDAGIPNARTLQAIHGRAGRRHVPAGVSYSGKRPCEAI